MATHLDRPGILCGFGPPLSQVVLVALGIGKKEIKVKRLLGG